MAALVKHKFRSFLNLPRIQFDSTEDLDRLAAEKKEEGHLGKSLIGV